MDPVPPLRRLARPPVLAAQLAPAARCFPPAARTIPRNAPDAFAGHAGFPFLDGRLRFTALSSGPVARPDHTHCERIIASAGARRSAGIPPVWLTETGDAAAEAALPEAPEGGIHPARCFSPANPAWPSRRYLSRGRRTRSSSASVQEANFTFLWRLQFSTWSTDLPGSTRVSGPTVSSSRNSALVKVS